MSIDGVLGIVATAIFGILAILLAIRRKYPGSIVFLRENCIGLFDGIVKNFSEIEVLYNKVPIKQELVLIKGILLNDGTKDITKQMIEEPLHLEVPDGFSWLKAKVVSSSQGVNARVDVVDGRKLVFGLGLLKCEEYVRFEALAEVPLITPGSNTTIRNELPETRLERAIKFTHRISDTAKVRTKTIGSFDQKKIKTELIQLLPLQLLVFLIGTFGAIVIVSLRGNIGNIFFTGFLSSMAVLALYAMFATITDYRRDLKILRLLESTT